MSHFPYAVTTLCAHIRLLCWGNTRFSECQFRGPAPNWWTLLKSIWTSPSLTAQTV